MFPIDKSNPDCSDAIREVVKYPPFRYWCCQATPY